MNEETLSRFSTEKRSTRQALNGGRKSRDAGEENLVTLAPPVELQGKVRHLNRIIALLPVVGSGGGAFMKP